MAVDYQKTNSIKSQRRKLFREMLDLTQKDRQRITSLFQHITGHADLSQANLFCLAFMVGVFRKTSLKTYASEND